MPQYTLFRVRTIAALSLGIMKIRTTKLSKKDILRTLKDMPEAFEVEDLIERFLLLSKIESGKADALDGRVHSMAEMREEFKRKWRE